jgi:hypothetical protein
MIPIRADRDFEETVAKKVMSMISFSNRAERALLFCNSRDECDRMAGLLGWKPYHSSVPINERSKWKKMWMDGVVLGLACTSMLNCCLDNAYDKYVFHLGPPRDAVDYYQAIGRAARACGVGETIVYFNPALVGKPADLHPDDLFGGQIIHNMLHDTSLCRRLRPGFFLDGIGVPCAMLPRAQLCDICSAELNCQQTDAGLRCIPDGLAPPAPSSPGRRFDDIQSCRLTEVEKLAVLPDPLREPAPMASFATHLAAANSCLIFGKARSTEDLGGLIRTACNNLSKSCVNCWSNALEYHSHPLWECQWKLFELKSEMWRKWLKMFRFPVGCCFYCGCPLKVCSACTFDRGLQFSPELR